MPAGYGWTRTNNTCPPSQLGHLDTALTPSSNRQSPSPIVSFDWQPQSSSRHHHRMLSPLSPLSAANSFSLFNFTPTLSSFFTALPLHTHAAIPTFILIYRPPTQSVCLSHALVFRTTPYQLSWCQYDPSYTTYDTWLLLVKYAFGHEIVCKKGPTREQLVVNRRIHPVEISVAYTVHSWNQRRSNHLWLELIAGFAAV